MTILGHASSVCKAIRLPSALIALCCLTVGSAFADPVPVTVSVTSDFDKKNVAINDTTSASLAASADISSIASGMGESGSLDDSAYWEWCWWIVSPPANAHFTITQDPYDSTKATVSGYFSDADNYTLTVKAKVKIGWSGGDPFSGNNTKDLTNTAVKVKDIQISIAGGDYQSLPSPLYVPLNKSVSFKALPSPDGAAWPSNYPTWSGSAGASGVASAKSVTFTTLSSSSSDLKTVTANCGNSTTGNNIVWDVGMTLTPEDNFKDRDLDAWGVCEIIDLSYSILPTGIYEYQVGGLDWVIVSGGGELISGTYQCTDDADVVVLGLQVQTGPFLQAKKGSRRATNRSSEWHYHPPAA